MPRMKSFSSVLAILAPFFASAITKEGNTSAPYTFTFSVADSNHHEGKVIDEKDLLFDVASDYDTKTDKQQSTIIQSIPTTPRLNDRRKLANTDSIKTDKKPQVKILVYDKINGYLNWMQPWFVKAAKERCSTICTVTENKNQVRHVMFIFMFMLLLRERDSWHTSCYLLTQFHVYCAHLHILIVVCLY